MNDREKIELQRLSMENNRLRRVLEHIHHNCVGRAHAEKYVLREVVNDTRIAARRALDGGSSDGR